MNQLVTALAIQRWADQLTSRSTLPLVLRRLAHATLTDISEIDFPVGESTQRAGFDGIIVCEVGNAWVPTGKSVWEFGVNKGVKSKADDDFEKRTRETSRTDQTESAYIAVTPRHWKNKRNWADEQASKGDWKEVRAYDADDIEQWIETAPAVGVWFAQLLGLRPSDTDDIEHRWKAIIESTTISLQPKVFLASRDASVKRLSEWALGDSQCLTFASRSPSEVMDFVCAAVEAMGEPAKTAILAKTVLIESFSAWKMLRDARSGLRLVVEPSVELDSVEISRALGNGHHVLVATALNRHNLGQASELEQASEFQLCQALEECGLTPVSAEQSARASAGSLAILKRRLARFPSTYRQQWLNGTNGDALRTCLLLGGWDGSKPADREAVEKVSGRQYGDIEAALHHLATVRDPLLIHAAGNWRVISKDEAWDVLGTQVTASALASFEPLAIEILTDDDPKYGLKPNERFLAAIKGHTPSYSSIIKKHVAETLAVLGAIGPKLEAAASFHTDGALYRIVTGVLSGDATWHRWASLGQRLPMLAEASPRAFLGAVKAELVKENSQLIALFANEGDPLFGGCHHAGLLWSIETLAWSPHFVLEVCKVLLKLDARDPGGKWANRPRATLCGILSSWMPYTTATVDQRIKILDALCVEDGDTAWQVLLALLPETSGGFSSPTQQPYWRDWANSWQRGVTYADLEKYIRAVAERIIANAATSPSRWNQILEHLGQFPHYILDRVVQGLSMVAVGVIGDSDRRLLADRLSEQLNLHQHHEDKEWALPADSVAGLEWVLTQLQPKNSAFRHAWLFAQWPDRYYMREGTMAERDKAIDDARAQALLEVIAENGFSGILELSQQSDSPSMVGRSLSILTGDEYGAQLIPAMLVDENFKINLANGFVWNRFSPDNWEWADRMLAKCDTDDARAWLLVMLPFARETWTRAHAAGDGVWSVYWERCRAFGQDLNEADVETAVDALVSVERLDAAIDVIGTALHRKLRLSVATLCRPLEALLTLSAEKTKAQFGQVTSHEIGEIFSALQDTDIDPDRLVRLEWQYLRMLNGSYGRAPQTLHKWLSERPVFFVEVLSMCFKAHREEEDEEEITTEPSTHHIYMAEQACRLLRNWDLIPGTQEDGSVDEEALRKWCNDARFLAGECGQQGNCDSQIGQLLSQAPHDPDGSWPIASVRRVVEEIGNDRLGSGLRVGILNSRSAGFRAKGGDQERELAAKYSALAERIRFDFHFVAGVLDEVTQSYLAYAKHWDELDRWEE